MYVKILCVCAASFMEVARALPCHGLRVRSERTVQPHSPKRRGRFDVGGGVEDVSMAHGGLYIV